MTARGADWLARAEKTISAGLVYDWPNVPVEKAQGCRVWGTDGKVYLDFCSGMASVNTGHCHPRVVAAVKDQAEKLIHGPVGVLLYEPLVALAEELGGVTPEGLDQFFFLNSGSEAVEGAVKLARYVTGRPAVVSFVGGFHGRTMGAVALTTSKSKYRRHYEPLMGGVYNIPFPYCFRCPYGLQPKTCGTRCFDAVTRLFDNVVEPDEVAAFIIEPIMGEGGYAPAPRDYLGMLREVTSRHGIMLIFDEIQTGFGRTGRMFAADTFGVTPDIMTVAKGIASGMPLSAVVAGRDTMSRWTAGAHGTTFGGNPLSCAAARATLRVLEEENLLDNARAMGERAMTFLSALADRYPLVGDVRGEGLMIGIELVDQADGQAPNPKAVEAVLAECFAGGLILYPCGTYGQVIRFIPPLVVTARELDQGLSVLERAIAKVSAGGR